MKGGTGGGGQQSFGLRRYLAGRLAPVVLVLLVVVMGSAPIAYLVMGAGAVRERAAASADHVAEALRAEIQEQPLLWKYNTFKILSHLRAQTIQASIERIEVTDTRGVPVDLGQGGETDAEKLVWESAPIRLGGPDAAPVAEVWVGATLAEVQREALILLSMFAALAAGLAGLVYWLPIRAMGAAESRIGGLVTRLRASQEALESLNTNLEQQVDERSAELAGALAEVRDQERRILEMSGRAIELQEAERRALSRDLHDSAGQALTAIRINLQLIAERSIDAPTDVEDVRAIAARTLGVADTTLEDVRRVVDRLGPSILDDMGLAAAVERYCDDFAERTGVAVEHTIKCPERLEKAVEAACYRSVQEALTNISRHAQAESVSVSLVADGDALALRVRDDGEGFEVQEAAHKGRRGLRGMRERAELLGGVFELRSAPGSGTTVGFSVPLRPPA